MAKTPEEQIADLKAQKQEMSDKISTLRGELTDLKAAHKGEIETLKASHRDQVTSLGQRIDALEEEARNQPVGFNDPLEQVGNTPLSRYAANDESEFVWHEAIDFRDNNGYDRSQIFDRAKGVIDRALGLGDDGSGMVGADCERLPPFRKDNTLHVRIWVESGVG